MVRAHRESGKGVGALWSRLSEGMRSSQDSSAAPRVLGKAQHGKRIHRPRLPELPSGEAEEIVIRMPE